MSASVQSNFDNQSTPPSNTRITLQVGERCFTTLASTLSDGSSFFASLLSTRWVDSQSKDGSYFIDADPDLFAHILRYLRRGVLPIVYEKARGFDHAFYRALQKEAEYFGINPLYEWIEEKNYLRAVTIQYSAEEVKGEDVYAGGYDGTVDGNTERWYHPSWRTEKVYHCPRDIFVHHGNPKACGKACEKAKSEDGDDYIEQDILRTLIVTKKTVFTTVG